MNEMRGALPAPAGAPGSAGALGRRRRMADRERVSAFRAGASKPFQVVAGSVKVFP